MSSEDRETSQRDAFAAIQQLQVQSPSLASLQAQLMKGMQPQVGMNTPEAQTVVIGEQYLVFMLADQEFAVRAEMVQGVERPSDITPVPNAVPWVKGVMNLRGSIVSVVDLRLFLDLEPFSSTSRTRLLSLQHNDMVICFVVDGVSEMLPIPASAIVEKTARQAIVPTWAAPYASGSALLAHRVMVLLDVPRLLFSEKIQRYQAL